MKRAYNQREENLVFGIHKKKEDRAFNMLVDLDRLAKEAKYENVPAQYIPRTEFNGRTANGLAKMILRWFELHEHKSWRQSSEGRYRPGETITDVLGHVRQMKGQWLPGQNNGAADVCAIVRGQFVAVEVKINDQQSPAQKQYQKEVTESGGLYVIARSFGAFMDWYEKEIAT